MTVMRCSSVQCVHWLPTQCLHSCPCQQPVPTLETRGPVARHSEHLPSLPCAACACMECLPALCFPCPSLPLRAACAMCRPRARRTWRAMPRGRSTSPKCGGRPRQQEWSWTPPPQQSHKRWSQGQGTKSKGVRALQMPRGAARPMPVQRKALHSLRRMGMHLRRVKQAEQRVVRARGGRVGVRG